MMSALNFATLSSGVSVVLLQPFKMPVTKKKCLLGLRFPSPGYKQKLPFHSSSIVSSFRRTKNRPYFCPEKELALAALHWEAWQHCSLLHWVQLSELQLRPFQNTTFIPAA